MLLWLSMLVVLLVHINEIAEYRFDNVNKYKKPSVYTRQKFNSNLLFFPSNLQDAMK